MTDATTTADKLAAWELIEKYGLDLFGNRGGSRMCAGPLGVCGTGLDDVAAVKDWAERAGVEWKPPQVEKRWTFRTEGGGFASAYTSPELAAAVMEREGYGEAAAANYVVPCEVVIKTETEGV